MRITFVSMCMIAFLAIHGMELQNSGPAIPYLDLSKLKFEDEWNEISREWGEEKCFEKKDCTCRDCLHYSALMLSTIKSQVKVIAESNDLTRDQKDFLKLIKTDLKEVKSIVNQKQNSNNADSIQKKAFFSRPFIKLRSRKKNNNS